MFSAFFAKYYAEIIADRKARKQAKKVRKQAAAMNRVCRTMDYQNRADINSYYREQCREFKLARMAFVIIEQLGSPPDLLQAHYERYQLFYQGYEHDWE